MNPPWGSIDALLMPNCLSIAICFIEASEDLLFPPWLPIP
jgi:hypothetical protein